MNTANAAAIVATPHSSTPLHLWHSSVMGDGRPDRTERHAGPMPSRNCSSWSARRRQRSDRARLFPDDPPLAVAPLVVRGGPRRVDKAPDAGDDDVDVVAVAQDRRGAVPAHLDRRRDRVRQEVDGARANAAEDGLAGQDLAERVDQLEVAREQRAGGVDVGIDQRVSNKWHGTLLCGGWERASPGISALRRSWELRHVASL